MKVEWDPEKQSANIAKHGLSLEQAAQMDWDRALVNAQTVQGERRYRASAPIGDRVHICVYTLRGEVFRIISLRKANRREVCAYLKLAGDA